MRSVLISLLAALFALAGAVDTAQATSPYDMRGEWSVEVVCKACNFPKVEKSKVTAIGVFKEEQANGDITGPITIEGGVTGILSGTITGDTVSATMTFSSIPEGPLKFTLPGGTIEPASNTITGEGTWEYGTSNKSSGGAIFTGTRLHTLAQVEKREKEEQEAKQKRKEEEELQTKEREAREAKEKLEREEAEAAKRAKEAEEAKRKEAEAREAQAREAQAREAQAKREKEALEQKARIEREPAEHEAKARAEQEAEASVPPGLVGKTLSLASSGSLSLKLSNPNSLPADGEVELLASHGKVLGKGSFRLTAYSAVIVKLQLAHSVVAELRHKTLRATARVVTMVEGHHIPVANYTVTLHGSSAAHHKHR